MARIEPGLMHRKMLFLFKTVESSLNKKRIIEDSAYKYGAFNLSLWGEFFQSFKKSQQPVVKLRRELQGLLNRLHTSIQVGSSYI